jgi:hypothetical protein
MSLILDGTNGLSDVDGSAATPALRGTDANTGIFFPAADTIAFSEGGVEAMRIDSSGNVGIGVTPAFKLDISGGGSTAKVNTLDTYDGGASISTWQKVGRRAGTGTNAYINTVHSGSDAVSALTWAFGTSGTGTEAMRIDSSGNLLVGTTTANGKISSFSGFDTGAGWDTTAALSTTGSFGGGIAMIDGSRGYAFFCSDNGNDFYIQGATSLTTALTGGVYLNDRGTSWTSASDERQKTIIEPITDAINKVCQLRTVIGRYNYEPEGKRHPFLIAQDVQAVLPEAVSVADKKSEEQYLGVSYTDTIPLLVAAIKEQQALITALTTRITALETAADSTP